MAFLRKKQAEIAAGDAEDGIKKLSLEDGLDKLAVVLPSDVPEAAPLKPVTATTSATPALKPIPKPASTEAAQKEWAHVVKLDAPIPDYDAVFSNAMEFPFELDPFQKQAVYRLEKHESVFVAAHTSAGKTVVADYAIALSRKHTTR
jgi:antiviral helicase SKI2